MQVIEYGALGRRVKEIGLEPSCGTLGKGSVSSDVAAGSSSIEVLRFRRGLEPLPEP